MIASWWNNLINSKSKAILASGAILLFIVLILTLFFETKIRFLEQNPTDSVSRNDTHISYSKPTEKTVLLDIKEYVSFYSEQIAKTTDHSDRIQMKLLERAQKLTKKELSNLSQIFWTSTNGDERSLSLYLLAHTSNPDVIENLEKIVMELPELNDEHQGIENQAFQAMAVEGIAQFEDKNLAIKSLENLIQNSKSPWVQDRATRSLLALQGKVPSIETQDRQALKNLLNKKK